MATSYSREVYEPQLRAGIEYQDFLCVELHRRGIVLQNLQSKKYQLKKENLFGLEIKFDDKLKETGNLYIETAEKSDPGNPRYVQSGIYRDDNTWLYAVGDYSEVFVFPKNLLKRAYEKGNYLRRIDANSTETSRGFLLTREMAKRWAARHIVFASEK